MQKTFEAVYENGVLRPLAPLALANAQRVQVTIADLDSDVASYFDAAEWEASKHDDISLQEVRAALSSIEGSLSDAVIASREERF
jgi:predicted DNA-binding antitoxin AbrB/MazE fold protein